MSSNHRGGFVVLYRTILDNVVFRSDAEAMAFAWLVLRAAWKPTSVRYKNKIIDLERGQLALSIRDMAEHLERSKDWAKRFLERLSDRDMVATVTATGVNIITICNYEKYQIQQQGCATATDQQPRQNRDRTATQNNKGKERKEIDTPPTPSRGGEEIVFETWNSEAEQSGLPTAKVLSPERRRALKARIKEHGLDGVMEAVKKIHASPHCRGSNDRNWKADFEFLLQPKSCRRAREGGYDGQPRAGPLRAIGGV